MLNKKMTCFSSKFFLGIAGIFLFAFSQVSHAQKVTASLDSAKILIGDHVHLKINITAPAIQSIQAPVLTDSLIQPFELVEQGKTDTLKIGNEFAIIQNYTISCFNTGKVFFPSLPYFIQGQSYLTDSIPLQVETIQLDTTGQLKPIKGPIQVPLTFKEVLPYFYWALLAAAIILGLLYIYRKYFRKKETVLEETIIEPPHIIALNKLKAIEEEKLWQQDRVKEYYVKVSDTIREYIENRFSIHALEQTTDELMTSLKRARVNASNRAHIERILTFADLAKFAKTQPLPNENADTMRLSVEFVEKTKQNTSLEDRTHGAQAQKKFYQQNEYQLHPNSLAAFNTRLIIGCIAAAIVIPFIVLSVVYLMEIMSVIILLTNYSTPIIVAFLVLLATAGYVTYYRKQSALKHYRFIFSNQGITERNKGKKDLYFTHEQIKSITENKTGEMTIYTADIHLKMTISPFIERREEVKERLAQITPVEFV